MSPSFLIPSEGGLGRMFSFFFLFFSFLFFVEILPVKPRFLPFLYAVSLFLHTILSFLYAASACNIRMWKGGCGF